MLGVLSNIAVERIEKLGMRRLNLPLGTPDEEPHTVIFVSQDFETNKEKVVVLVTLSEAGTNPRFRLQMSLGCGLVECWMKRLFT
jgi:hypothetical protein